MILPIERVDQAVLAAIGGEVLRPEVVQAVIDGVFAELTPEAVQANAPTGRGQTCSGSIEKSDDSPRRLRPATS